jgi:hypothetical protein
MDRRSFFWVPFGLGIGEAIAQPTGSNTVSAAISPQLDTLGAAVAQGNILYRGSTSWTVLAAGTNGQLLQTQGAGANPKWVGGMVLLNTLSPSAIASVSDTTSLTSTYRDYVITFENLAPATQTVTFEMQIATNASNWVSAGYVSLCQVNVGATLVTDSSTTTLLLSGTRLTTQLQTTSSYGLSGSVTFFNPSSGAENKQVRGTVSYLTPGASGTATFALADVAGYYDAATTAITGVNFLFSSGNITTGTIKIYGLL